MLRPLSRHPQSKPEKGQIVRDVSGARFQVVQVGLKYLVVLRIKPDGTPERSSQRVKMGEVIVESPETAPDPVDAPPKW